MRDILEYCIGGAKRRVATGTEVLQEDKTTGQRLFNIYDGPAHQDANAYLNIKTSDCNGVDKCMYYGTAGVRRYLGKEAGYLPNAAIGWKQPNGFYYPPAFHSKSAAW